MLETLFEFLKPTTIYQVTNVTVIFIVLYLVLKGKVSSVGKDGIHFNKIENSLATMVKELESALKVVADASIASKDDREQLHQEIDKIEKHLCKIDHNDNEQSLELLKVQILLAETLELKMFLHDKYKKRGGNSWTDLYMDSEIQKSNNASIGKRKGDDING